MKRSLIYSVKCNNLETKLANMSSNKEFQTKMEIQVEACDWLRPVNTKIEIMEYVLFVHAGIVHKNRQNEISFC